MLRLRQLLPALLLTASLPGSGWAEMTPDEREEFREEVRAYLLENPELLNEMVALLEARQREPTATLDRERIAAQARSAVRRRLLLRRRQPRGQRHRRRVPRLPVRLLPPRPSRRARS